MAAMGNSCFWLADISKLFSETTWPIGTKLGRKYLCKVLYKISLFRPDWTTNMAARDNSCFWLANISKIFSSETIWPMKQNYTGSIFTKFPHFVMIGNMAAMGNSCFWLADIKILLLWNGFTKWNHSWQEALVGRPLQNFLISSW